MTGDNKLITEAVLGICILILKRNNSYTIQS